MSVAGSSAVLRWLGFGGGLAAVYSVLLWWNVRQLVAKRHSGLSLLLHVGRWLLLLLGWLICARHGRLALGAALAGFIPIHFTAALLGRLQSGPSP